MKVTTAYMYTVKNLGDMLSAVQRASVPPKFTYDFLQTLGFKSTNDRAFINVLKGLGFLDSNSTPTPVYAQYRDKDIAKKVLGQQVRRAYEGLFMSDEHAQGLSTESIKGKLATLTGKDEAVLEKMASTFKSLSALADFSGEPTPRPSPPTPAEEERIESPAFEKSQPTKGIAFSHVVYLNLPATKDVAVYDAIFKSLKEHIL